MFTQICCAKMYFHENKRSLAKDCFLSKKYPAFLLVVC